MIKKIRNFIAAVLLISGAAALTFGIYTYIELSNSLRHSLRQTFLQSPDLSRLLSLSRFSEAELQAYGSIALGAIALIAGFFLLFTTGSRRKQAHRRR